MKIDVMETFLFFFLTPIKWVFNFIPWEYVIPVIVILFILFVIILHFLEGPEPVRKLPPMRKDRENLKRTGGAVPPPLPNENQKTDAEYVFCPVCKRHVNPEKLSCKEKSCPFS